MGADGTFLSRSTDYESGREYKTVFSLGDNIKILERKDYRKSLKPPQESHTANRIYAMFYKDGHDVKEVAVYGSDGKKIYSIHTVDHKELGEHYHPWKDGRPDGGKAYTLTPEMRVLLNTIRKLKL